MTERSGGWILLHRKLFDGADEFWEDKRKFSRFEAWIDMLQMAAFADHFEVVERRRVLVRRGEVCASIRFLAERWGWSKSSVHRWIAMCVQAGRLCNQDRETSRDTYLVVNYESYQDSRDASRDSGGTAVGQQWDAGGTNIKVVKKEKEGKEGKTSFARSREKAAASEPEPGLFDSEAVSAEEAAAVEAKPAESEGGLLKLPCPAPKPAKDPPAEIPALPEDMAGWPGMLEAWDLRLKERAERPKRERPTPSAVLAQFGKLREVAKLHGTDAAVACVVDAAANSYQGTVFPEDLDPHGRRAKDGKGGSSARPPKKFTAGNPGGQKIEDGCIWGPNATIKVVTG